MHFLMDDMMIGTENILAFFLGGGGEGGRFFNSVADRRKSSKLVA
jgi:hypothetical protein